jgi:ribosomal protein L25 (general stress protein Ctc)
MAAPDTGGTKRANAYAKHLGVDMAICYKQRKVANQVESMTVIGDVKGKNVVLVDDMVDTAGTLTKAADMMMEQGASSVRAVCTHAVLSGDACERIQRSALTELIVTDTIPMNADKLAADQQDQATFRGQALRRRDPSACATTKASAAISSSPNNPSVMNKVALSGSIRNDHRLQARRPKERRRREKRVPCVLYGGDRTVHFSVDETPLGKLCSPRNTNSIDWIIDGRRRMALVHDKQFHPSPTA